jgi:hypothetical protein
MKRRPVGRCTKCCAAYYNTTFIKARCIEKIEGEHCNGIVSGAQRETDWTPCRECSGAGVSARAITGGCIRRPQEACIDTARSAHRGLNVRIPSTLSPVKRPPARLFCMELCQDSDLPSL